MTIILRKREESDKKKALTKSGLLVVISGSNHRRHGFSVPMLYQLSYITDARWRARDYHAGTEGEPHARGTFARSDERFPPDAYEQRDSARLKIGTHETPGDLIYSELADATSSNQARHTTLLFFNWDI